ncbi:MAG: ADP-heptose--LPS heptosyltransferase [Candidatus Poribacteria bacterium]|nr:MAG: ADP-heptose--LPS heptosyltransferase [Candidatus Poribacteria bacterium]
MDKRPKRILVLSFTHVGDATLSTAVIPPLRATFPEARLVFLVGERAAPLLAGDPRIDRVIPLEQKRSRGFRGRWQLIRQLRRERFDLIVDLRDAAYSRLLGGRRIGLRDYGRRHAVDRYLDALRRAGIPTEGATPRLELRPEEIAAADSWLRERGLLEREGPLIGVHPGGNWSYKLWPPERFGAVVQALVRRLRAVVLVFAGPGEETLQERLIAQADGQAIPVPVLPLRLLAALIARCRLYLGNDTGPMHIAAAVGVPVVALFEPTDDQRSGPYGPNHRVLRSGLDLGCNPCHPGRNPGGCQKGFCPALLEIPISSVIAAALEQLGEEGEP